MLNKFRVSIGNETSFHVKNSLLLQQLHKVHLILEYFINYVISTLQHLVKTFALT